MMRQRGSITVITLVMFIIFLIIFTATIQYISRQSHGTVDQEQEEQAFGLADAGVQYALWLITPGSSGGGYTPPQLYANPPSETVNYPIITDLGEFIGTFTVEVLEATPETLRIRSVGRDAVLQDRCQVVEADYSSFATGDFQVVDWRHELGFRCRDLIGGCIPYAIGVGQTVNGALQDTDCTTQFGPDPTSKADIYTFNAVDTDVRQMNLNSTAFTGVLTLREPNGTTTTVESCSAGADACISDDGLGFTITQNGTHWIEVASNPAALGAYTLEFTDPANP